MAICRSFRTIEADYAIVIRNRIISIRIRIRFRGGKVSRNHEGLQVSLPVYIRIIATFS